MSFKFKPPRINYRAPKIPKIRPPRIPNMARTHSLMRMAGIRTFNCARPNYYPRYKFKGPRYGTSDIGTSSWVGLACFIILCVLLVIIFI